MKSGDARVALIGFPSVGKVRARCVAELSGGFSLLINSTDLYDHMNDHMYDHLYDHLYDDHLYESSL